MHFKSFKAILHVQDPKPANCCVKMNIGTPNPSVFTRNGAVKIYNICKIHTCMDSYVSKVLAADGGQRRLAVERSGMTATIDLQVFIICLHRRELKFVGLLD